METKRRKAYNEAPVRPLAHSQDRRLPNATLRDLVLERLEAETQLFELPPMGGGVCLPRRAAREDGLRSRHVQRDRRRSSSAAEITSPRFASAIDAASSPSPSAVSSKGASASPAFTVPCRSKDAVARCVTEEVAAARNEFRGLLTFIGETQ
jgi:hypothetical protein